MQVWQNAKSSVVISKCGTLLCDLVFLFLSKLMQWCIYCSDVLWAEAHILLFYIRCCLRKVWLL